MKVKLHTWDRDTDSKMKKLIADLDSETAKFRGDICNSINSEIISTLHVRCTSERGVFIEQRSPPSSQLYRTTHSAYDSWIRYVESLCRIDHEVPSEKMAVNSKRIGILESWRAVISRDFRHLQHD